MRIKRITSQSRRDFRADYECEHCAHVENAYGYDDNNFHENVIPKMACAKCGKAAGDDYQPQATKYAAWEVV
jgi:hypothetical protein